MQQCESDVINTTFLGDTYPVWEIGSEQTSRRYSDFCFETGKLELNRGGRSHGQDGWWEVFQIEEPASANNVPKRKGNEVGREAGRLVNSSSMG